MTDPFAAATKAAYKAIASSRALGRYDNTHVYGAALGAIAKYAVEDLNEARAIATEAVNMARSIYAERSAA